MIADKSVLLEQINTAIKKKWDQSNPDITGYTVNPGSINSSKELQNKKYFSYVKNIPGVKKLEQRIEALECQNEQLLYFINFLVENLPGLVVDILHADKDIQDLLNPEEERAETSKKSLKANYIRSKDQPDPTRREKDVLELLVKGFCAKEIAHRLFISETTVITHKKNLKEKFKAKNTVELISKAYAVLSKINKEGCKG